MPYIGNTTTSFNVDSNNINNGSITTEKIAAGAVVNADVNDSASIAGTKISADFGAQDLIVDTNLLFVDVSTDRVGVGTSSPGALLHCDYTGTRIGSTIGHIATTSHGDASDYTLFKVSNFQGASENTKFFIRGDGNVGIGTTSPAALLHLADNNPHIRLEDENDNQDWEIVGSDLFRIRDITNSSADRFVINSSGLVGIGTTSPGALLNTRWTGSRIGSTGVHFATSHGDSTDYDLLKVSTSEGSVDGATKFLIRGDGNVSIGGATPTHPLTIKASSDVDQLYLQQSNVNNSGWKIHANASEGDLVFFRQGAGTDTRRLSFREDGGIMFGSDTAAANALDDYEEGTWEPTLTTAAGDFASLTFHPDTGGRYTKIGSRVYLNGCVRLTAFSVGTVGGDSVHIGGLPFTSAQRSNGDNADDIGPLYPTVWTGGASSTKRPTHSQIIHNLNTELRVLFYNPGSSTAIAIQGNDLGSTINIYISLVYTTSQ